jgi:hypothetical protein
MTPIHIIKKHGGARKGAGRKPGSGGKRNRISRSISLPLETWREIDRKRGKVNRSRWIESLADRTPTDHDGAIEGMAGSLPVAGIIPHPWKDGQIRNVYEFPVTRKIIIEADSTIPAEEILAMAKRCHDKEIGLKIMGVGYQMLLSQAERIALAQPDSGTKNL